MKSRSLPLLVLGAALAAAVLGGCASPDSSEPVTAPPPSIVAPASAAPSSPSSAGGLLALHGTIQEGVEANCVLLVTDSKTYLLIGGDRSALNSGAKLTVYGTPEPGLMTTCQQGTPFVVESVRPA